MHPKVRWKIDFHDPRCIVECHANCSCGITRTLIPTGSSAPHTICLKYTLKYIVMCELAAPSDAYMDPWRQQPLHQDLLEIRTMSITISLMLSKWQRRSQHIVVFASDEVFVYKNQTKASTWARQAPSKAQARLCYSRKDIDCRPRYTIVAVQVYNSSVLPMKCQTWHISASVATAHLSKRITLSYSSTWALSNLSKHYVSWRQIFRKNTAHIANSRASLKFLSSSSMATSKWSWRIVHTL